MKKSHSAIVCAVALAGISAYFFWPRIDLKDGTELTYRLDSSRFRARMDLDQRRMESERSKDPKSELVRALEKRLAEANSLLSRAESETLRIVRARLSPITPAEVSVENGRLFVRFPKSASPQIGYIMRTLTVSSLVTFHNVIDDPAIVALTSQNGKATIASIDYQAAEIQSQDGSKVSLVIEAKPAFESGNIQSAIAGLSANGKDWEVSIQFDLVDALDFARLTESRRGKKLAIALGGKIYSAPVIREAIYERCRISGSFSQQQAENFAAILVAWRLPSELVLDAERQLK